MATNTRDREQEMKDDLNPAYIFSLTHTELLCRIVSGELDATELARKALAERGVDHHGKWVGFKTKQTIKQP